MQQESCTGMVPARTVQNRYKEMICVYTCESSRDLRRRSTHSEETSTAPVMVGLDLCSRAPGLHGFRGPGAAVQSKRWCGRNHLAAAMDGNTSQNRCSLRAVEVLVVGGAVQYDPAAAAVAGVSCRLQLHWPSGHMYTQSVRGLDTASHAMGFLC